MLLGATGVLLLLCALSLAVGARHIPPGDVWQALVDPHDPEVEAVVRSVRVPRTLLGLSAGAALGVSGTLMQALTRNPLADPGILGVTGGASFAVVLAVGVLGVSSLYGYVWFAFAGALAAGALVYLLGGVGRTGMTPVKLALAGMAVTAMLNSLTSAVTLTDTEALNRHRFWAAGSLAGQETSVVLRLAPFLVCGLLGALALAPALNSLALGDEVAVALGRRTGWVRVQGAVAVTLLTGGAVAVVGPLVFVGLVVPHLARALTARAGVGPDHRWLLPLSMVIAPGLLLAADVLGRLVAQPGEMAVGIVMAFLGGPFFIALVRRRRLAEL
ncbi:iron ABC transporter permease [Wenjunlia vitaminophila]|uniref:Iron ABC transporter permease n=1 Tax=Wenjunlia vitaminophila TaxID=76728 RepID=A0A0T6LXZ1_WENVI|nr:iron ABC transporter permease [Wenjunlia vitaminophila]